MKNDPEIVKELKCMEKEGTLHSLTKQTDSKTENDFFNHSTDHLLFSNFQISYKALLDNANVLVQSVSPQGKIIYVNKKWKEVLGYSENELSSITIWDILREDQIEKCKKLLLEIFEEQKELTIETVFKSKSGESVFVQGNVNISIDEDNTVSTIGFFRDVTLEKQYNKEYEMLFNEANDALFIQDIKTGKILDVNKKMCKLYGYSKHEALSLSVNELSSGIDPYTQKNAIRYAKKTLKEGPQSFIWNAKTKENKLFWAEITLKIINWKGKQCFLTAVRDISQKILVENKLKENEKKFRMISNSAADAIIMMSPDGNVSYWNPAAEKIFGYKPDEIIGKNLHDTISPERFRESFYEAFSNFKKTGDGSAVDQTLELTGLGKDGQEFPIELSLSSVNIDDEWHAISIIRDISDRKKNESKLQMFSEAVKQNPVSVVITDPNGNIEYVNPKFESLTGYSIDEVKGKNPRILKSGDQPNDFYQELWDTIKKGNTWHGEFKNKKKNNEIYWEKASISPIKDNNGSITHFIAIKEDISYKKQILSDLHIKENAIMSSINGMMLIDLEGKVKFVNKSFLEMWDISSEEDIYDEQAIGFWKHPGKYLDIIDKTVQGEGWFGEIEATTLSKESFFVQLSANLVLDEKNEPAYIMNSFVDISNQKKLEEEFKKFKTISDKAGYGSLIHSDDGIIQYVNNAFAIIHGYSTDELIGNHISVLFNTKDDDEILKIHKQAENHKGFKGKEVTHKHKTGSDIPLLMSSTHIGSDELNNSFYAETFIDISDLKDAQRQVQEHTEEVEMMNIELNVAREQLATLNKDLEKKVDERTKEVKKLLKQKDGFINQLGHDLRTPLTPMLGLLPLIKKRISDEKGLTYISMIDRNIHFMKDLVNKTITYAKLNSDKITFNFVEISLFEFIKSVKEQLQITLDEKQVNLSINVNPSINVIADEMQLKEVFHNLISNAIKYGPKEGDVNVLISATRQKEDIISISIKDNGIGMSENQIEHIFDEFYKADDARTDIDSHGLGLTICKRIIRKHDGTISVNSEGSDKGSEFQFTLHSSKNFLD